MEATWTPNEQDDNDGGPLPLSQAHRDQLLQLEQAILASPDPQGTLMQVAQANNMDPQDLVNMLERNHNEMSSGGGAPSKRRTVQAAWPQTILKGLSSLGWMLSQMAHGNPRAFALASLSILFVLHVLIHAPRTGLVMSTGTTRLVSRGATTFFYPPTTYINKVLESQQFPKYDLSLPRDCKFVSLFDELPPDDLDGIQVHKLSRKSELVQAVTAQQTLDANEFLSMIQDDDDVKESDTAQERALVMDTLYDAAAEVLSSRRLTEFVSPPKALRIQSNHDEEKRQRSAILVVQKMGNWGRFGLQPLRVSSQHEGESVASLTFTTLKGGHFDGQIAITVERTKKDTLVIQIRLGIPKKGRKLNEKVATQVVDAIAQSIQKSITTQTRQTLARKSQGKRYHSNYESRTKEKRQIRFENERKAEEMAKDRRRKWQRQNPDAGRYRPSGDRMKSPNNC
jgi:uncharacterized protein (UPF0548 family)